MNVNMQLSQKLVNGIQNLVYVVNNFQRTLHTSELRDSALDDLGKISKQFLKEVRKIKMELPKGSEQRNDFKIVRKSINDLAKNIPMYTQMYSQNNNAIKKINEDISDFKEEYKKNHIPQSVIDIQNVFIKNLTNNTLRAKRRIEQLSNDKIRKELEEIRLSLGSKIFDVKPNLEGKKAFEKNFQKEYKRIQILNKFGKQSKDNGLITATGEIIDIYKHTLEYFHEANRSYDFSNDNNYSRAINPLMQRLNQNIQAWNIIYTKFKSHIVWAVNDFCSNVNILGHKYNVRFFIP